MLKIIKAELYKSLNRPYLYVFFGCIAVFMVLANIALNGMSTEPVTVHEILSYAMQLLSIPVFLVLPIVGICTNEELKEKTLRNTVSFGVSRSKLYIGKIITSIILSVIAAITVLAVFVGSAFILFKPGDGLTAAFLGGFFIRILAAVPLYSAALAIGALLGFVIKNEMIYAFTYAGLFVIAKQALQLMRFFVSDKFTSIYNMLITVQLSNLGSLNITDREMTVLAGIGLLYTIVFTIIGIIIFRKQEIK